MGCLPPKAVISNLGVDDLLGQVPRHAGLRFLHVPRSASAAPGERNTHNASFDTRQETNFP
jgi:hypothetical protein